MPSDVFFGANNLTASRTYIDRSPKVRSGKDGSSRAGWLGTEMTGMRSGGVLLMGLSEGLMKWRLRLSRHAKLVKGWC